MEGREQGGQGQDRQATLSGGGDLRGRREPFPRRCPGCPKQRAGPAQDKGQPVAEAVRGLGETPHHGSPRWGCEPSPGRWLSRAPPSTAERALGLPAIYGCAWPISQLTRLRLESRGDFAPRGRVQCRETCGWSQLSGSAAGAAGCAGHPDAPHSPQQASRRPCSPCRLTVLLSSDKVQLQKVTQSFTQHGVRHRAPRDPGVRPGSWFVGGSSPEAQAPLQTDRRTECPTALQLRQLCLRLGDRPARRAGAGGWRTAVPLPPTGPTD